MIPTLNKIYNYFDDGKIRPSRRSEVVIKEIIPFNEIDSETLAMWEKEVEICDWLYEKTTDYFIKAQEVDSTNDEMVFVRTKNNGWFSLGFCAGRLDIDGTLNEICEKQFETKQVKDLTYWKNNEEEMEFIKRCIKVYWEYHSNRVHPDNQKDWNISQRILNK
jgi:hypothetical protein